MSLDLESLIPETSVYILLGDKWTKTFTIPSSHLPDFSNRPFPFLRLVCFVVIGVTGELLVSRDGPAIDDDSPTVDGEYFYQPDTPVDLVVDQIAVPSIKYVTKHAASETDPGNNGRISSFRSLLISREDGSCMYTGVPAEDNTHACHFIPNAKGDAIRSFTTQRVEIMIERSRQDHGHTRADIVNYVSDIRNGALLTTGLNGPLNGESTNRYAILVTPNFRFRTQDVPGPSDRVWTFTNGYQAMFPYGSPRETRNFRIQNGYTSYTLQSISNRDPLHPALTIDHNLDALPSYSDPLTAPSKLILDLVYGAMFMQQYGDAAFIQLLESISVPPLAVVDIEESEADHGESQETQDSGDKYKNPGKAPNPPRRTQPPRTRSMLQSLINFTSINWLKAQEIRAVQLIQSSRKDDRIDQWRQDTARTDSIHT
ncbi:hypothetical protein C8J56DRAFT_980767 [Mycena floridula]|nr:hypothetical protein C8J56DRAFT_980767 [Mycena floridula]